MISYKTFTLGQHIFIGCIQFYCNTPYYYDFFFCSVYGLIFIKFSTRSVVSLIEYVVYGVVDDGVLLRFPFDFNQFQFILSVRVQRDLNAVLQCLFLIQFLLFYYNNNNLYFIIVFFFYYYFVFLFISYYFSKNIIIIKHTSIRFNFN